MRIAVITDAAATQVSGVVRTYRETKRCVEANGHQLHIISAAELATFACPKYPEIRLTRTPYPHVAAMLDALQPDCIHIATEGPMGLAGRRYCLRNKLGFTTAYHTRIPEIIRSRSFIPLAIAYRWLRWFHSRSTAVMVPTAAMQAVLEARGFRNVVVWGRGVDTGYFQPEPENFACLERPVYLYVGRVAAEKNIEDFLRIDLPGTKWIIGDGPQRDLLERRYPDAHFLGRKEYDELAPYYNCADVFVFPSRTDTFGQVMAEAMACGVPVAAYPVPGPLDVVEHACSGVLDEDLARACFEAIRLDRRAVREHALKFSWQAATRQFLHHLAPVRPDTAAGAVYPSVT